ncbi:hypothetical protein Q4Q39_10135 [Flavivirga amylovorans]|uniref:Transposase DDE domain-containing protein n=1 Tax=Flavivirga amylovorans TaxID=870486 RepID=A0ABT8X218_9FLAO|nr:hypothetical protein [Flavivirga amylovorans]MDO5987757.1 hypothetical protein [Flavivirga amylovorans]
MHKHQPEEVFYDRGSRGKSRINDTKISIPAPLLKNDTEYQKRKKRKKFRRMAVIEPVIGHLKKNFRMQQNDLSCLNAPKINAISAATGWNLKKMMEKLKNKYLYPIFKSSLSIWFQNIELCISYSLRSDSLISTLIKYSIYFNKPITNTYSIRICSNTSFTIKLTSL